MDGQKTLHFIRARATATVFGMALMWSRSAVVKGPLQPRIQLRRAGAKIWKGVAATDTDTQ